MDVALSTRETITCGFVRRLGVEIRGFRVLKSVIYFLASAWLPSTQRLLNVLFSAGH